MVRAVFFDLDGTLADTEAQNAEAVARVLARTGRPVSDEERRFVIGHGWAEIYAHLEANGGIQLSRTELMVQAAKAREELVSQEGLKVLPGAVALVRRVSARLPATVVSGSSREEIAFCLNALGVAECFPWFIGAEDTARGKPAPDGYLLAARRFEVPPERCVVIEDSTAGIAAAKAAGMRCVAVRAGNFADQPQGAADLIVGEMTEIDDRTLDAVVRSPYTSSTGVRR
jgi:HAD superfamily hydrolase (TIGR01509 family)